MSKRARTPSQRPPTFHLWADLFPELQYEVRQRLCRSASFALLLTCKCEYHDHHLDHRRRFGVPDWALAREQELCLHYLADGQGAVAERLAWHTWDDTTFWARYNGLFYRLAVAADAALLANRAYVSFYEQHAVPIVVCPEDLIRALRQRRLSVLHTLIHAFNRGMRGQDLPWPSAQYVLTNDAIKRQDAEAVHWLGDHGYLYPYCFE